MKIFIFIFLIIATNFSIFATDPTNSFRLKGSYGMGTLSLPEKGEMNTVNNGESLYLNLLNPSLLNPYSITSEGSSNKIKSVKQIGFEYRYQDNLRVSLNYRDLDADYSTKTQHIPGFLYDPTSDNYKWKEIRKNVGLEYYFPMGEFFKIGPLLKYYKVDQNYTNEVVRYYDQSLSGSLTSTFTNTESGTKTSFGKYSGFAPGIAMEFKITDWFRIGLAGEYIKWNGTKTTELPFYTTIRSSATSSGLTTGGYFSDTGAMEFRGFFGDLTLQFRPFSLFGLTLGYHRENYNRKYNNYSYQTSAIEPYVSSSIYNSLVKSANPKFTSEVYYLQAEFILDL